VISFSGEGRGEGGTGKARGGMQRSTSSGNKLMGDTGRPDSDLLGGKEQSLTVIGNRAHSLGRFASGKEPTGQPYER